MTQLMRAKLVRARLGNISPLQLKRLADSKVLERVYLPGQKHPFYKVEQVEKLAETFNQYEIIQESEESHVTEG